MKTNPLLLVFALVLNSCIFGYLPTDRGGTNNEEMQGDNPMTQFGDETGWNPAAPPNGGFDDGRNYNLPGSQQKNRVPLGWQQNVRVQASNVALGPLKNFFSTDFPDAGVYTAQFSITQPSQLQGGQAPVGTGNIRCQATLNWIVEGNQVQRIFDIGSGTTISGAGAGAIIQVQDLSATLPFASGANNLEYGVSVSVTKGTRAQFQVPVIIPGAASQVAGVPTAVPNAIGPVTIPAGSNAFFPVPQNAGVIAAKVMARDLTTPATRPTFVSVQQRSDPVGLIVYALWLPDVDPGFVPLVPGVQLLIVSNLSGADQAQVSVEFAVDG
jgi:hypothetical protein